jgi:mono/diheme cytochrome c family protein
MNWVKMNRVTKTKINVLACVLALSFFLGASLARAEGPSARKDATAPTVARTSDADAMRLQGEQRYRANCGRCHAAPRKFPPRMMATVLRHMRVRATITDEDMRLVLLYMSQ